MAKTSVQTKYSTSISQHREVAASLNRALLDRGFMARVSQVDNQMTIFIEGSTLPQQASLCRLIYRGLRDLDDHSISHVKIYGRQIDNPEASWKTEFTLPVPVSQAIVTPDYSAHLKTAFEQSTKFTLSLLSNKRFQLGIVGLLGLGLLAVGSLKGINLLQEQFAQRAIIQDAQETVQNARTASNTDLETMRKMASDLTASRSDLRNIPNSLGSLHNKAQAILPDVETELNKLEQAIALQEEAVEAFEEAIATADRANQSVKGEFHTVQEWSDAKTTLQSAINQLSAIPEGSLLADSVTAKLTEYKTNLTQIEAKLATEQTATASLNKAQDLAKQAYDEGLFPKDINALQRSQQLWTQAINQIRTVPNTSYSYRYVERRLQVYQGNLNSIAAETKEMQECLNRSKSSPFSFCYVGYVSLQDPERITWD